MSARDKLVWGVLYEHLHADYSEEQAYKIADGIVDALLPAEPDAAMVERVARAIAEANFDDLKNVWFLPEERDRVVADWTPTMAPLARAAYRAMRETI